MTYKIFIEPGQGFDDDWQMRDTWTARVDWVDDDGKRTNAVTLQSEWKTEIAKRRLRNKLNEQRRRLERHLKATGKRWEVERAEEKAAKRAADHAAKKRREAMRDAGEEMYAVLAEMLAAYDAGNEAEALRTLGTSARIAVEKAETVKR